MQHFIHCQETRTVIVGPNEFLDGITSIGIHIVGGYARADLTKEQVEKLIQALTETIKETA